MGKPLTPEHREKLRQAKLRNPVRYWLGKTRPSPSEETRAKVSAANKARPKPEGFGFGKHGKGVPRPQIAETMRQAMGRPEVRAKLRGPNPNKARSPEHYARLAEANRGTPARYPMKRFYYGGEAFRSEWELRVAKSLDVLGVRWEYEKTRFDLGTQTYAPDFYLPDGNCYWEVKGYYGPKSQATVALFRQQYPAIPLVLVFENAMKALERAACRVPQQ